MKGGVTGPRARRIGCAVLVAGPLALVAWMLIEPRCIEVSRPVVALRGLPTAFEGLRVAVLTDIHHGPFLSRKRVAAVVRLANAQQPDAIVIAGDMVHRSAEYIEPVWAELSGLRAPLGVYAVLGNHDHWEGAAASRQAMAAAGITDLTGRAASLRRQGERVWLVGLGDLWEEHPDLSAAMRDVGRGDVALVLSHNPDAFEQQHDPRAQLWLAGHTHGGQVVVPWFMKPVVPSQYGQKYRAGLVEREGCRIYVSRGIGCITPPVRLNCRPELPVITLR